MADWYTSFIAGLIVGGLLVAFVDEWMGWRKKR